MSEDVRWQQRLDNFLRALQTLRQAAELSELEIRLLIIIIFIFTLVFLPIYFLPFLFLIACVFFLPCYIFGLTVVGNVFLSIGGFYFIYGIYQEITTIGIDDKELFILFYASAWPFFGGLLLRRADKPIPPWPEIDKNAKICDNCNGKGKVKTGERYIYDYKMVKKDCNCYKWKWTRAQSKRAVDRRPCPYCNDTGYYKRLERCARPSKVIDVMTICKKCQKTGYTGEHVKKIIEIKRIIYRKILSFVLPILYIWVSINFFFIR